jgi:hypothetical protein
MNIVPQVLHFAGNTVVKYANSDFWLCDGYLDLVCEDYSIPPLWSELKSEIVNKIQMQKEFPGLKIWEIYFQGCLTIKNGTRYVWLEYIKVDPYEYAEE